MRKKEKPVESKAEYYFGDDQVLERAMAENEFEGSRVEEREVEEFLRIQGKLSDLPSLPSFWKDLFTKLAFYSKTPILFKSKTYGNISGTELIHLDESFFQAHPCQMTLLKEFTIDSYFYATKIFKLTGLPNASTIPDLALAVFCYLVHSTSLEYMAPYQIKWAFVREDEVEPLAESDCPNWRSFWTEALGNKINRACIEHLYRWPGKPQRIVTFDNGSTIIVQKEPNEFYVIERPSVHGRSWKYGNYKTPYNPDAQ